MIKRTLHLLVLIVVTGALIFMMSRHTYVVSRVAGLLGAETASMPTPPLGDLLDPARGLAKNARMAEWRAHEELEIAGLDGEVRVLRDQRGVPHIFADSDKDATMVLGYVVAADRLFQMDFMPRVVSGRLSEILGDDLLPTDRMIRATGMLWSAERNLEQIIADEDSRMEDIVSWYMAGANAYIDGLSKSEYPVEFKLLGYAPERRTILHSLLLLQYMNFDLSYWTDHPSFSEVRELMNPAAFEALFTAHSDLAVPILPDEALAAYEDKGPNPDQPAAIDSLASDSLRDEVQTRPATLADSAVSWLPVGVYEPGKGSNNWAVDSSRSATGRPILSGDMHLALRLPAIWYEAHIVTPTRNAYGVTIPGAPTLVEAFNDRLAWAFTNTGADQIDHYGLVLDESKRKYLFEDRWIDLTIEIDTLDVRGTGPVLDTLRYTHWGPILHGTEQPISIQWTAHKSSRTLLALWEMGMARNLKTFEQALRFWDTPMQNILVATMDGDIAIRSTGFLPIRANRQGVGVLDGTSGSSGWTGRVPFEALPYAVNPSRGFLASSNQEPAGEAYPYYLGHFWDSAFRSVRIDQLMRSKQVHTVADISSYQSDVTVVQHDLFVPVLDTLELPRTRVDSLRRWLLAWDGKATTDRFEPLLFDEFLNIWLQLVWDEFADTRSPETAKAFELMASDPASEWFDIRDTHLMQETAPDVVRAALKATVDSVEARYGWDRSKWRWGAHHGIRFDHLLRTLRVLGRGPYEYPGFESTLSPAAGRRTTHGASWRMVVDFSGDRPVARGIYPGGQSGNPFSRWYDNQIYPFLEFQLFTLSRPSAANRLSASDVNAMLNLLPVRSNE